MATQTAYERFMDEFILIGMAKNSCKFQHKNGAVVYVSRNNVNKMQEWENYEIVNIPTPIGTSMKWIKATISTIF